MSFVAGASASIAKTIKEIEAIHRGHGLPQSGPRRRRLRSELRSVLIKSAKVWYGRGFNRGHKEAFREFKRRSVVPVRLAVVVEREFLPGTKSKKPLVSRLDSAFRAKCKPPV